MADVLLNQSQIIHGFLNLLLFVLATMKTIYSDILKFCIAEMVWFLIFSLFFVMVSMFSAMGEISG